MQCQRLSLFYFLDSKTGRLSGQPAESALFVIAVARPGVICHRAAQLAALTIEVLQIAHMHIGICRPSMGLNR